MAPALVAIVTGASAGIGAATVRALASDGYQVVAGARREEPLIAVCEGVSAVAIVLDVTNPESVDHFVASVADRFGHADVLINNAGVARRQDIVAEARDRDWEEMLDVNVLGLLRMTRAVIPLLRLSARAHIVNVGSTSGFEVYPGGSCYAGTKHAVRAITRTLRLELLGEPIRVTEIAPGLTATEFYEARFGADHDRARRVFDGVQPLTSEDVAECIRWVVSRPPHVNIDELVVRPLAQATATVMHRAADSAGGAE
jgi:3-hydroxy acid dehydrogenase/malonic semialdehyde reductase